MGKYDVERACGHSETVRLYGPLSERDRRLAWMRRTSCSACYREERAAEGPEVFVRPAGDGVEVVVLNSYAVRKELADRGYVFGRHAALRPITRIEQLLEDGPGGWSRKFRVDEIAVLGAELEWMKAQMWQSPKFLDVAHSLVAALVEGRPDLLPRVSCEGDDG